MVTVYNLRITSKENKHYSGQLYEGNVVKKCTSVISGRDRAFLCFVSNNCLSLYLMFYHKDTIECGKISTNSYRTNKVSQPVDTIDVHNQLLNKLKPHAIKIQYIFFWENGHNSKLVSRDNLSK